MAKKLVEAITSIEDDFAQEQLKGLEYMVAKLYEHRLQSDCVHEQVAKADCECPFYK